MQKNQNESPKHPLIPGLAITSMARLTTGLEWAQSGLKCRTEKQTIMKIDKDLTRQIKSKKDLTGLKCCSLL